MRPEQRAEERDRQRHTCKQFCCFHTPVTPPCTHSHPESQQKAVQRKRVVVVVQKNKNLKVIYGMLEPKAYIYAWYAYERQAVRERKVEVEKPHGKRHVLGR